MIQHRGDPEWDARRRVAHPGTFNANPLSAVAGATCLEILDRGTGQRTGRGRERTAPVGPPGGLARLGIPGLAYGLASGLFVALGVEGSGMKRTGAPFP